MESDMTESAKIKLTDDITVDVVDPDDIVPVYAEILTEFRVIDGVACVSFANIIMDGDNAGIERKARVCARLRISPGAIRTIQRLLSEPDQPPHPNPESLN
jgi:catalase (peroxidase I)